MILPNESYATPVFHVLGEGKSAAVLEGTPYPTPVFYIDRLPTDGKSLWRVKIDYSIGFSENMLQRSDVLEYMIQAQQFIDTSSFKAVRDSVTRLLQYWKTKFPRGIPDTIL